MRTATVNACDTGIVLTIRVRRLPEFRLRTRVGVWILRVAAWILPVDAMIVEEIARP